MVHDSTNYSNGIPRTKLMRRHLQFEAACRYQQRSSYNKLDSQKACKAMYCDIDMMCNDMKCLAESAIKDISKLCILT